MSLHIFIAFEQIKITEKQTSTIKTSEKTTKEVTIDGIDFPAGSRVDGRVVDVKRPGIKHQGYIRVKFITISNGSTKLDFPKNISEASAEKIKNPFFLSRILAFPLTGTGS